MSGIVNTGDELLDALAQLEDRCEPLALLVVDSLSDLFASLLGGKLPIPPWRDHTPSRRHTPRSADSRVLVGARLRSAQRFTTLRARFLVECTHCLAAATSGGPSGSADAGVGAGAAAVKGFGHGLVMHAAGALRPAARPLGDLSGLS